MLVVPAAGIAVSMMIALEPPSSGGTVTTQGMVAGAVPDGATTGSPLNVPIWLFHPSAARICTAETKMGCSGLGVPAGMGVPLAAAACVRGAATHDVVRDSNVASAMSRAKRVRIVVIPPAQGCRRLRRARSAPARRRRRHRL